MWGNRLNGLDGPVFMAGPKPMLTEFGIYHRLESGGQSCCNEQESSVPLLGTIDLHFRHYFKGVINDGFTNKEGIVNHALVARPGQQISRLPLNMDTRVVALLRS